MQHFKPTSYSVSKKFGGFLCTSGHVNLKIEVERTAYLSAENLVLEGQIENASGRRIDNVVGMLQKVIEVMGGFEFEKLIFLVSRLHKLQFKSCRKL
jgi:hypothetical protein